MKMNESQKLIIGGLLALLAGVCFSSGGFFIRSVTLDHWEILFFRCLFASVSILFYLLITKRKDTLSSIIKPGWPGLSIGLMTAWAVIAYVIAIQTTLVANVLAIMTTSTIIVTLLSGPLLGERVPIRTWLAVACGVSGIGLMLSEAMGGGQLIGNFLAFTIALAIAGQTIVARRFKSSEMIPSVFLATVVVGIISLPNAVPFESTYRDILILATFGIIQLALALILFFSAARFLPAPTLILVVLIDALLAPLWVWIGFNEIPNLLTFIGASIILIGVGSNSFFAIWELKFFRK